MNRRQRRHVWGWLIVLALTPIMVEFIVWLSDTFGMYAGLAVAATASVIIPAGSKHYDRDTALDAIYTSVFVKIWLALAAIGIMVLVTYTTSSRDALFRDADLYDLLLVFAIVFGPMVFVAQRAIYRKLGEEEVSSILRRSSSPSRSDEP